MSRFFSTRHIALQPYVPGEQPKEENIIKLNNNFIYAVPIFLLGKDSEYENRGKSCRINFCQPCFPNGDVAKD